MKKISFLPFLVVISFFFGCIGEDIINDGVNPEVRILNPILSLSVSDTYQYNATYFNNVGQPEVINILWSCSNESVATINNDGIITGLSEGETTVKAIVNLNNNTTVEDSNVVMVVMDPINQSPAIKTGNIMSTSNYALAGSFKLQEIENTNNLLLSFESNYKASTSLPGLYVYLTNNPNSVANAYSLGPVTVFEGVHTYTITNVGINDYSYLLYWCKPFGVKVGGGQINN